MQSYTKKLPLKFGMGPVNQGDGGSEGKIMYIKLPYIGPSSDRIAKSLKKILKNICGDGVDLKVVFYQKKISSLFSFKDQYSSHYANNVVYRINCPDCNSVYIGETSRRLTDRFKEHLMKSFGGQKGVIYHHCSEIITTYQSFFLIAAFLATNPNFIGEKFVKALLSNQANHPLIVTLPATP